MGTTKPITRFRNRAEAGRQLARRLEDYRPQRPIVLALPRGGVPVGYELAVSLAAPLEVFVARKLGAPGHAEMAIGAIAEGGVRVLDPYALRVLGLSDGDVEALTTREAHEVARRVDLYRGGRPLPDLSGHTAIVVDDGLATGMTAEATLRSLRAAGPARLVLATPVCAPETAHRLSAEADDFVCLLMPEAFLAVGYWYEDFSQTTDEEVLELLGRVSGRSPGQPAR